MKTKLLLTATIISSIFFGCKKDTTTPATTASPTLVVTPSPTPAASIVGSWSWTYGAEANIDSLKQPYSVSSGKSIVFASDGTYSSNFSYTNLGTQAALNSDNGTYTYTTDSLIIHSTVTNKYIRSNVLKLTSTELWIHFHKTYYEELHFVK